MVNARLLLAGRVGDPLAVVLAEEEGGGGGEEEEEEEEEEKEIEEEEEEERRTRRRSERGLHEPLSRLNRQTHARMKSDVRLIHV